MNMYFLMDWTLRDAWRICTWISLVINVCICANWLRSLVCYRLKLRRLALTLTEAEKKRIIKVKIMIIHALDQEIGRLEAEQQLGIRREINIRQVLEMITLLVNTLDVNVKTKYGPPLHVICGYKFVVADPLKIVAGLLSEGASLNSIASTPTSFASTPLYKAVTTQNAALVELLANWKEIDLERKSSRGWTPLHKAASLQDVKVVRVLIKAGANLDARDYCHRSPIHLASHFYPDADSEAVDEKSGEFQCNGAKIIVDLVLAGADVEAVDTEGQSCIAKALASGCVRCVSALLNTPSPLKLRERECAVQAISNTIPRLPLHVVKLLVEFFIAEGATPYEGRLEMVAMDTEFSTR